MKTYIKPALQVREIRVMENLAKITPAGARLDWLKGRVPSTVYSLGLYSASGQQNAQAAVAEASASPDAK